MLTVVSRDLAVAPRTMDHELIAVLASSHILVLVIAYLAMEELDTIVEQEQRDMRYSQAATTLHT